MSLDRIMHPGPGYPEPDTDEEPDVEEIEVMLCRENVNSTIPPIKLIHFKGKLRRKHK